MNIEWIIIEVIANIAEMILIYYLLCKKFNSKFKSVVSTIIFCVMGVLSSCFPIFFDFKYYSVEVVGFVICLLFLILFRSGSIWRKLFWMAIIYAFLFAIVFIVMSVFSIISGNSVRNIALPESSATRFQAMVISRILQVVLFYILSLSKKMFDIRSASLIICFIIPFVSFISGVMIYNIFLMDVEHLINEQLSYIISISYMIINIVVFVLYERMNKEAEKSYMLIEKQKQYDMIEENNIQMNQIYSNIKIWQHDYRNHMQLILSYLEKEDLKEAEEYIKSLDNQIILTNIQITTGNYLVDTIVSSKMTLASTYDIKYMCEGSLPEVLEISKIDLCAVISNLLDNAIEACQKVDKNRYIEFNIHMIRDQLYIYMKNSSDGKYKRKRGELDTTKKGDFHGVGLKHIHNIIDQYNGMYKEEANSDYFSTEISIPLR